MLNVNHYSSIFTIQDASHSAFELYGLRVEACTLPGERDYNFHLKTEAGQEFVLKVAPSGERKELLDLQNKALEHLAAHDPSLALPQVCITAAGEKITEITNADGTQHFSRMLTHAAGQLFAEIRPS